MSQTQPHPLPASCPVTPLGIYGDMLTVMDSTGQKRDVSAARLNRFELTGLFGGDIWLCQHFPKVACTTEISPSGEEIRSSRVVDFDINLATTVLIESCKVAEVERSKDKIAPDTDFMLAVGCVATHFKKVLEETDISLRDGRVQQLAVSVAQLRAISARDMAMRKLRGVSEALDAAGLTDAAALLRKAVAT